MIDKPTIARIMDSTKIEEVVSEFVTLKKRGINYIGLCPFHNDSHPSFSVSPTRGICHCFTCGKGGNAVNFLMGEQFMKQADPGIALAEFISEPTLKSKACLKCLYFTKIISALCCYLEYFSYLYTIN